MGISVMRLKNWHGELRRLRAKRNWNVSTARGRGYVRNTYLTYRPIGERCTDRLEIRRRGRTAIRNAKGAGN